MRRNRDTATVRTYRVSCLLASGEHCVLENLGLIALPHVLPRDARSACCDQDRLVGYDRDAAKRTAVIDDQSDFFEIDSNAWLTSEARLLLASVTCRKLCLSDLHRH